MEITLLSWIQALGSMAVGLAAVWFAYYNTKKTIDSKRIDDERRVINQKLNEFYGPFEQLRKRSKRLYDLFIQPKGDGQNMLFSLLQRERFGTNDKALVTEIISIDSQLSQLILEKSGLIDQKEIRDLLAQAATHFIVISLAYERKLRGETERFASYTFPAGLDEMIADQIDYLRGKLQALNR